MHHMCAVSSPPRRWNKLASQAIDCDGTVAQVDDEAMHISGTYLGSSGSPLQATSMEPATYPLVYLWDQRQSQEV